MRVGIGDQRFLHSLGTMHLAVALADRHGEGLAQAATAGLLHDCGRLPRIEQVEAEARRRALALTPDDLPYAKVWHAALSAHIAEHDFGITDASVLRAILLHPTGDAGMTLLDQIVFLADYLEPTRQFDGLSKLRDMAERDLGEAFRQALLMKVQYIRGCGRQLHPRSLRALSAAGISLEGGEI